MSKPLTTQEGSKPLLPLVAKFKALVLDTRVQADSLKTEAKDTTTTAKPKKRQIAKRLKGGPIIPRMWPLDSQNLSDFLDLSG